MSLYADYLRERSFTEILEKDYGFATYELAGDECYIKDLYVIPSKRKEGLASEMANEISQIAKEKGCKYLTGSVCPSAKGSDASLQILSAYGMKLHSSRENLIIFKKDII